MTNFLSSTVANIISVLSSVAYSVSSAARLSHKDKVLFSPHPHCVGDSSAWNQVLLVLATSLSVEVKASGVRGLTSTLIRWASESVLHIN